ncbi:MAG: hydroxymethylglutaryl-CoA lyase [Chloroflexi bacterium]|nr:hydroxymethylglutaryl-CoA lyase [Chloroflexota bacterium]
MLLNLPRSVTIREESPRDGLQNERAVLPTETKVALINALLETGVPRINLTSFVHPQWVPQLADAADVLMQINRVEDVSYSVLIPNARGLERALEVKAMGAKVNEVNFVLSATESHNKSNVNKTIAQSLSELPSLIQRARQSGLRVYVTISMSFGCAFEGVVSIERVMKIAKEVHAMGTEEIDFGDTAGMANPRQVYDFFMKAREVLLGVELTARFHDTRGLGLVNVLSAMQAGVTSFDSSLAGLGGCPFSPGATGNICTEDLVNMLHEMGVHTGIDLNRMTECAGMAQRTFGRPLASQILKAGPPKWASVEKR